MPLLNDKEKAWTGWLVDNLGNQVDTFYAKLEEAITTRELPKCKLSKGKLNMWWRKDSRYLDVISELDGTVMITIHIQEYGKSLYVGRAVDVTSNWNYYKRMATQAFIESVDRCIVETVLTMAEASAVRDVKDVGGK